MEINYELTEEDYIKFNLYHIQNSPSQKKIYLFIRFVLPVIFALPIYFIGTGVFQQPRIYWLIIAILFAAGWPIAYPKRHKKMVEKQTKKLLHEGDNSSFFGKKTMSIDKSCIKIIGEHTSQTISRENIKTIKIFDNLVILYLSAVSAQLIPTGNLNGETKKQLLNELGLEATKT